MKTVTLTLSNGEPKTLTAQEITDHYATETCEQYGWGFRSAAWYELARCGDAPYEFLTKHAQKMHPEATLAAIEKVTG